MKKCFIILLSSLVACSTLTSCNLTGVIIAINKKFINKETTAVKRFSEVKFINEERYKAIKKATGESSEEIQPFDSGEFFDSERLAEQLRIRAAQTIEEERYNNEKPKHSPHFAKRRAAAIKQSKIDTVTRDEFNQIMSKYRK